MQLVAAGIIIPALVKVAIADAQVTKGCLATNHQALTKHKKTDDL